jgi:hypothetical protein
MTRCVDGIESDQKSDVVGSVWRKLDIRCSGVIVIGEKKSAREK